MSPLYHRLAKQLTLPVNDRDEILEQTGVPRLLSGAVCFDLTAIPEMVDDIAKKFREGGMDGQRAFLPAPKTWIEFAVGADGVYNRSGILIEQGDGPDVASCFAVLEQRLGSLTLHTPDVNEDTVPRSQVERYTLKWLEIPLGQDLADNKDRRALAVQAADKGLNFKRAFQIYAALAIINTPQIIGRRQHMPHRGLERDLLRNQKAIGKFPLRAWTEITLEATPSFRDDDGVEHQAHLTGRKCLHFCRAHLRVANGRLVLVSSHWRGDPALGIKRSRYKVVH